MRSDPTKRIATAFVLTAATVLVVQPTPALAAAGGLALPVSGSGSGATFTGTFTLQKFVTSGSGVDAIGMLTGTVTDALGRVTTVAQNVTLRVYIGAATCAILHLDIGPVALDLLGLQVNLSEIILDITARSGAGNLLGNLLCAVAGLLDQPGGLPELLNDILGVLV
jgi:hypothetical protein